MKALNRYKQAEKQHERDLLETQYKTFENTVKSAVCFVISTAILVFEQRGRKPQYIRDFIKDMMFMFDMPVLDKKRIDMTDQMKQQEQKYNFCYDDLIIHIESKKDFKEGLKNG